MSDLTMGVVSRGNARTLHYGRRVLPTIPIIPICRKRNRSGWCRAIDRYTNAWDALPRCKTCQQLREGR